MEAAEEVTLRPRRLAEFVGQAQLKEHLEIMLEAARRRGQPADHLLFAGPPGLGKTSLAGIVATEMGAGFRITSGPALVRAGDLAAILTNLAEGDVLFVDEIHRLGRAVEEILYPAMEDFQLDIVLGKGPSARSIRLDLPRFTLVGATTRTGLITGPLRDRFGFVARLDYYSPGDLDAIIRRSGAILGRPPRPAGAAEIARRSRGTPRIANRLLKRVRDFAEVRGDGTVDRGGGPARASSCSASTSSASTRWTGPSWTPSAPASAAARSACRPWPSASARRPTPSRTCTSPSCCSWPAHAHAQGPGRHRRRPGSTSAWTRPSRPPDGAAPGLLLIASAVQAA